jgi:hypothetical protein
MPAFDDRNGPARGMPGAFRPPGAGRGAADTSAQDRAGAGPYAAPLGSGGASEARSGGPGGQADTGTDQPEGLLPSITLPRGGGAIRGIDEKFSANLATGTGSFAVPIATSPGRGGFGVSLRLEYDSGAGNGPWGIGWRLSVPQIARKTSKGLPRYADGEESDIFILSGAEDLVPVASENGEIQELERGEFVVRRYRPRTEGMFARIERWTHRASGDVHWRATTPNNVLSIYGRSEGARIADPDDPRRVFSWLLEETHDDRGNAVRYTYKAEDGAGVDAGKSSEWNRFQEERTGGRFLRAPAQRYLKRIQYGNRTPLAREAPAPEDPAAWLFEVV